MPGASVTDTVNQWKGILGRLKSFRSSIEADWRKNLQQYKPQIVLSEFGDLQIRVNYAFSDSKIMLRSALAGDPFVYVKPTNIQWEESSDLLQVLVNDNWRTQLRKRAMRGIILDSILLKKGYGLSHFKKDRLTGQEGAWLTRLSPWNVYMDDGANVPSEAFYWFRKVLLPYKDAVKRWPKAKDYLKPVGMSDVRPQGSSFPSGMYADYSGVISGQSLDDLMGRVVVYELHNQLDGQISTFTDGYNFWLDPPRRSPYPRSMGSLLTELVFNEVPDEQYGISDLEPVRTHQEEQDRVRSEMFVHTRRFRRRYRAQKNNLDAEAKEALETGHDGVVIEMNDASPDGFNVIEDAPMSSDIYNYEQMLKNDRREILGIAEYMRAGSIPGTKTKYEVQQIMGGSAIRGTEKAEMTEWFIEEVTRKDIAIIKTFYDQDFVIRIAGPDGYKWQKVSPSDLTGVHEVEVHVGSVSPKDDQAEFMKGQFLYQTLANDPMVNHVQLLDRTLKMWQVPNRFQLIGGQVPQQPGEPGGTAQQPMNPAMDFQAMSSALGGGLQGAPR